METFSPGDVVLFEVTEGYWMQGVVDYVYQTNGELVIKTEHPLGVYERKPSEVRRL